MMIKNVFEERHFEQRVARNADQAEFQAILAGQTPVDAGFYDDEVAGATDDFDVDADEAIGLDWHQRELAKEAGVGSIQEEIERRQILMGRSYPFRLVDNAIHYRRSGNGIYEFLLAASIQTDIMSKPYAYIVRAFEKLSALIVQECAGPEAHAYHVGAPRLGNVPARFDEAMRAVSAATGEWHWAPNKHYPEKHASTGDEGLDFIVACPWGDRRPGQLFMIGQCACGDDWDGKWTELNFDKLRKWFNPGWVVMPVRVFTTPYVLSAGHMLDAQAEAGLLLDRVRMVSLASRASLESPLAAWPGELRKLTALVVKPANATLPIYHPPFDLAAKADRVSAKKAQSA